MGCRANANPEQSDGACASGLSIQTRAALTSAGLQNCRTEFWHWSFGCRYWALQSQQPAALYGPIELP